MNLQTLLLSILVTCCSHTPVSSDVERYRAEFKQLTNRSTIVPVTLVSELSSPNAKSTTIGVCYTVLDIPVQVELLEDFWRVASDIERKLLVFHELIHCELGFHHHIDLWFADGCPVSIMSSELMPTECFHKHRHYYLNRIREGAYQ